MEEKKEVSVREIFRQILKDDQNLLNSRDELSKRLEKEVPAALTRDMKPIQAALQKNIGEIFLAAAEGNEAKRQEACAKAIADLEQDGMLEKRAQEVVSTFVYALEWEKDEEEETELDEEMMFAEENPAAGAIESHQEEVQDASWKCVCGQENTGKFCVACGAAKDSIVNMAQEPEKQGWKCSCGQDNTGRFCVSCGNPQPGAAVENAVSQATMQQPELAMPQPAYTAPQQENKAKPILIVLVVFLTAAVSFFVVRGFMEPSTGANKTNGSVTAKQATEKQVPSVDSDLSLGGVSLGYSVDKLHEILGREKEQKKGDYGTTVYLYDGLKVGIKDGIVVGLTSDGSTVKTKRDMHEGSNIDDVFAAYGKDYTTTDYDGKNLYEYTFTALNGEKGILRFAVEKSSNKVNYISVRLLPKEEKQAAAPQAQADVAGARSRLLGYYQAISNHSMQAAYGTLTSSMQNQFGEYSTYSAGYKTTISSAITNIQTLSSDTTHAQFEYDLKARDRASGNRVKVQTFHGTANMVLLNGTWYIDSMSVKKQGEYME